MLSNGSDDRHGEYPPPLSGAGLTSSADILDDGFVDFRCVPLTVEETLLETSLAGPGPEAIRLLETLQGRPMTEDQALAVAAGWERQARWLSARAQAANLA
ncbi:MAG: hypothetical protein QOI76_2523, partial [Frankiales bacterium]|nr:hypothetical protein [Frankiales bacterium]